MEQPDYESITQDYNRDETLEDEEIQSIREINM